MKRPGLLLGRWQAANAPAHIELLDLGRDPSSGRPAQFLPGPYYLGASGRTIHHDNPLSAGGLVATVPFAPNAHLLKAAPDLFNVALVLARLPDHDTLAQAARVAGARALGVLA
jgi:hypothetical protein